MKNLNKKTKFPFYADVASITFLSLFVITLWWMYVDLVLAGPPYTAAPILPSLFLFFDGLPFLFGFVWLLGRYATGGPLNYKFFRLGGHLILFVFLTITPLVLMAKLGKE